jgi:hypothetical protein
VTRIIMRESEAGFQEAVTDLASLHGWRWWHDNDSRRNKSGFPDLVLARDGVLIFAELKTETGKVSPAQTEWLAALERVQERCDESWGAPDGGPFTGGSAEGAVQVYVWRPKDWESIESTLSRRRST